jgi:preprotein translocase subunit SecF
MSRLGTIGAHLYRGDVSIDFVGRRKTWYLISLGIVVVALAALVLRGLNFGIEFKGGVEFQANMAPTQANVLAVENAVVRTGIPAAQNPIVTTSGSTGVLVQTEPLTTGQVGRIARAVKSAGATEVSQDSVGPTWGQQIASQALIGLIAFLILVVLLIWAYFREWRMSVAGIVALAHDLMITVGIYALTGFEVTPATVTGLLTILGYSLYDTVVVFDKVRENTRGLAATNRRTYADAANLAVNQTLVRSINTSLTALLPVGAILWVGTFQLGSGPLKDLALALFIGMAAGTYSSIFIATPLLAQLKMREPAMQAQARRVKQRQHKDVPAPARSAGATVDGAPAGATVAPAAPAVAVVGGASPSALAPPASGSTAKRAQPASGSPAKRAQPASGSTAKRAQPSRQARSKRRSKGGR